MCQSAHFGDSVSCCLVTETKSWSPRSIISTRFAASSVAGRARDLCAVIIAWVMKSVHGTVWVSAEVFLPDSASSQRAGGERWKSFERNNTENTNHVGLGGEWKYPARPEQCIEPRVYSTFI